MAAPAAASGLSLPAIGAAGPTGLAICLLVAVLTAAWALRLERGLQAVAALTVLAGASWSIHGIAELRADPLALRRGSIASTVTITGDPRSTLGGFAATALVLGDPVELRSRVPLQQGAILAVTGRLSPVAPPKPGAFDRRAWLAQQGIHEILAVDRQRQIGRRGGLQGASDAVRRSARQILVGDGSDQSAQIVAGVVLGATGGLSDRTIERFRASGLAHLLAVSGGNVAILVGSLLAIAWLVRLPLVAAHAAAIGIVPGYALVVGTGPSVVRATVAGLLASFAWISRSPRDHWYILALGATAVQVLDPYAAIGPGFQLSFAAVWAIYAVSPRIRRFLEGRPCPGLLREPIALSLACTLVTAPISWWHFGRTSLVAGLPANLLALPAVAPLLWLGLGAVALVPILPGAAAVLAAGARSLGAFLLLIAGLGTQLGAALPTGGSTPGPAAKLRLTVLDVGEGSAALIEAPGLTVLIDTGRAEANVASKLERRGIHHLDLLLVSHDQADHAGGAPAVLERLDVARSVTHVTRGYTVTAGSVTLRVLGPEHVALSGDPNLSAAVVEARQGSCSFLLPADAESPEILRDDPPVETVLVVSHHGSADARLPELLDRIRPHVAVISVGPNSYGHPAPATLAALAAASVPVRRTDRDGDIVFECPG